MAPEVMVFVATLAPLVADAIKLRRLGLKPKDFRAQARSIKNQILDVTEAPAQHPGIQKIQNIFRKNPERWYHWAKSAKVPADNNRAQRELRPLVLARKISFGSQSAAGARTREVRASTQSFGRE